jgi:AcrR family transcriptional regulator
VQATDLQRRCRLEYRTALRVKARLVRALAEPADARLLRAAGDWYRDPAGGRDLGVMRDARRDPRTGQRIDAILGAACRLFAHRGVGTTRIADVAAAAGVSSALVHYHFRTKNELLFSALVWAEMRCVEPAAELLRTEGDHLRRLRGMVEIAVPTPGIVWDNYLLWLEFWVWARRAPQLWMHAEGLFGFHAAWLTVIEEGEAAGAFRPARSAEDITDSLVALLDGLSYEIVQGYAEMPSTRARELVWAFVTRELGVGGAPLEDGDVSE